MEAKFADRFWARVERGEPDACWLWTGGIGKGGYGYTYARVNGKRKQQRTHRISYLLTKGEIPPGMWVLHTCDVRPCVQPQHLYLGTHIENNRDTLVRGHVNRGEKVSTAKLTEQDVRQIRLLSSKGLSLREIAPRFGVKHPTISRVLTGKLWRHVE